MALGLALEASAYPKPGNVSPQGGTKGLEHWHFLASSTSIAVELYRILKEARYIDKCPEGGLGERIYRLYNMASRLGGGRNTHLGFTMLILPIAIAVGELLSIKGSLDISVEELLEEARDLVRTCRSPEDLEWISRAILEASPSYLTRYEGAGFDVIRGKGSERSMWEFIESFKKHDLILREIWEGYPRVYKAYTIININPSLDLYERIAIAFINIASENIDTTIARGRGYKVAVKVMREMRRIRELIEIKSPMWRLYAEILDRELRARGLNPGSIADIVATASSLYVVENLLKTLS